MTHPALLPTDLLPSVITTQFRQYTADMTTGTSNPIALAALLVAREVARLTLAVIWTQTEHEIIHHSEAAGEIARKAAQA